MEQEQKITIDRHSELGVEHKFGSGQRLPVDLRFDSGFSLSGLKINLDRIKLDVEGTKFRVDADIEHVFPFAATLGIFLLGVTAIVHVIAGLI